MDERDRDIEVKDNLSFQEVSEMVAEAIGKMHLEEPVLMGVGMGGNIILRVAERRKQVRFSASQKYKLTLQ